MSTSFRLAVHGLMLRDLGAAEAVAQVNASGYQGIVWQVDGDAGQTTIDALTLVRNTAARASIDITGLAFAPDDRNPVDPERAADMARALGAADVRVYGASMAGVSYATAYEATVRLCEAYGKAAQRRGVRVLLHQRWGTLTASASQLHRVLSNFHPDVVGCVYDAGSMTIEGYEEYRIGLEILGSYVADVHIANSRHFPSGSRTVWEWEWSPLSDGLIDLERMFRALRRSGYRGWVTLADRSQGPSVAELLEADRHTLRQAMDDLEGVGSHNPCRPLDDHVDRAERPERASASPSVVGAHRSA